MVSLFPRFHLGLFTFSGKSFAERNFCLKNPFRVGAYPAPFPQVPPGAIHIQPLRGWAIPRPFPQVSPGAIHIFRQKFRSAKLLPEKPFQGWGPSLTLPRFHLGLLSRYTRYCVSHSTWGGERKVPTGSKTWSNFYSA